MSKSNINEKIQKLGFGLMRLPMNGEDIDIKQVDDMIDLFMKKGFSYFDTAPVYINGKSEVAAREALVKRYPRESFQIATKLPIWMVKEESDLERFFNSSLEQLGVDYVDFYLLHALSASSTGPYPSSNLEKADHFKAWEFIQQKKAEGKIKHIGFSFHDNADVLDKILTEHPEIEFVQLQINYADWNDDTIQSKKCYDVARKHNVPIIIMEPVKGGTLVSLRPNVEKILKETNADVSIASWAVRYCASLDGIVTVLSGMSDMNQMTDNVSYMENFKPFDDKENAVIEKVIDMLEDVDMIKCTSCKYCVDDCPEKINIPAIFDIANNYSIYENIENSKKRYEGTTKDGGKASDCIACGSCENLCPQKLEIISHLKNISSILE